MAKFATPLTSSTTTPTTTTTTTARSRLVHAATRKSSIAKSISGEYSDYKSRLELLVPSVAKLLDHVRGIDAHWSALVSSQRSFADDVFNAYSHSDAFKRRLATAQSNVRAIGDDIASPKTANHPTVAEASRIEDYLKEVNGVLGECPAVERAYLDTAHYDAKAEKLSRKSKPSEHVTSNLEKLTASRIKYQESVDRVVAHMKAVYAKYPVVFSNAHASFWHAQSGASSVVSQNARVLAAAAPKPTDRTSFEPDVVTPVDQDVVEVAEKPSIVHDVASKTSAAAAAAGLAGAATGVRKSEKKNLFDFPKKKKVDVPGDSDVGMQQVGASPLEDITPVRSEPVDTTGEGMHTTSDNKKKPLFARHSFKKQSKDESPTTALPTSSVPVVSEVGEQAVIEPVASKDVERGTESSPAAHEKKKSLFGLPSLGKHERSKEEHTSLGAAAVPVEHDIKKAAGEVHGDQVTPAPENPSHGSPEASPEKRRSLFALPSLKKHTSGKEDSEAPTAAVAGAVAASAAVTAAVISDNKKGSDHPPATKKEELSLEATEKAASTDHTASKIKGIFALPSFKKHEHAVAAGTSGEEEVQVSEGVAKSAETGAGADAPVTSAEAKRSLFTSDKKSTAGPTSTAGHASDKVSATAENIGPETTAKAVTKTVVESATEPSVGSTSKSAAESHAVSPGSNIKSSDVSDAKHAGEPGKPAIGGLAGESTAEGKARPLGNLFGFMFSSKDSARPLGDTSEFKPTTQPSTALDSQKGTSETLKVVPPPSESTKAGSPIASTNIEHAEVTSMKSTSKDVATVQPKSDQATIASAGADHGHGGSPAERIDAKDENLPTVVTPTDVSDGEKPVDDKFVDADPMKQGKLAEVDGAKRPDDAKSPVMPVGMTVAAASGVAGAAVLADRDAARTDVITTESPAKEASHENLESKAASPEAVGAVAKVKNMFGMKSKGEVAVTAESPIQPAVESGDETVKTDKNPIHRLVSKKKVVSSKETPVEASSATSAEAVTEDAVKGHGGARAAMPVSPVEAGISTSPDDTKDEHDGKRHMFRLSSKKKLESTEEEPLPKGGEKKTLFGLGGKRKTDSAVEANEPAGDGSSSASPPYWVDSTSKGVDDTVSGSKSTEVPEIAPVAGERAVAAGTVVSPSEDVVEPVSKVKGTEDASPAADSGAKDSMQVKLDEAKDKVGAVIKKTASKFKIGSKKSAEPST